VLIERSGDVIPYIVKSLADARNGSEQKIVFPTNCPSCNSILTKPEEEAVWRCVNVNCPAQSVERIIHFVSKDAMDVKGLGEANIRRFYDLGWLNSIPNIFKLDFDRIAVLEGFGDKYVLNLKLALNICKQQSLSKLIFGLGIRFVGEGTAKNLERTIHHLFDLKEKTVEDLLQIGDVGDKVAASIFEYFHNEENLKMLDELQAIGLNMEAKMEGNSSTKKFSGLTFLFTGTLPSLGRSKAEEMVEANGGAVLGTVSKKLNYLIVGADAGSKLEKAKEISTIKIIDETEFMNLVNNEINTLNNNLFS
jgi:DNA ligase (NAD+)